jgi:hypothetical protein
MIFFVNAEGEIQTVAGSTYLLCYQFETTRPTSIFGGYKWSSSRTWTWTWWLCGHAVLPMATRNAATALRPLRLCMFY